MYLYVVLLVVQVVVSAPPIQLTIDCSDERDSLLKNPFVKNKSTDFFKEHKDVKSFCKLIQKAIPKGVRDGKFVLIRSDNSDEVDQMGSSNFEEPVALLPPKSFSLPILGLPKLRSPKLRVPKLNIPKLRISEGLPRPPKVGPPMSISLFRDADDVKENSAEKVEKFKKGVQKMLHVVKILGQIDEYLSERTRIIVDKLAKTLAE